jgi:uncharacterized membrane protein
MAQRSLTVTSPLIGALLASAGLSIVLFLLRALYSLDGYFLFMIWNLWLALIPLGASRFLLWRDKTLRDKLSFVILIVWLLFFPNAPYLITDLFHLYERPGAPAWLDMFMLFSFAWNGLIITYASLRDINTWLGTALTREQKALLNTILFTLTSFGLYLGRYFRWNSWDALWQPLTLLRDIAVKLGQPGILFDLTLFMTVATLFLWTGFIVFNQMFNENTLHSRREL